MIKDSQYQIYATTRVSDVPIDNLKHLVNVFIEDAALNMGSNYDVKIIDRIIEFVQSKDFSNLPISLIAKAFARGSLGKFGPGRLVPRTVHEWLWEVSLEYRREIEHRERERTSSEKISPIDINEYPAGQAIIRKIDWYNSGAIYGDEWDEINLKRLSQMISQGMVVTPQTFGIEPKK